MDQKDKEIVASHTLNLALKKLKDVDELLYFVIKEGVTALENELNEQNTKLKETSKSTNEQSARINQLIEKIKAYEIKKSNERNKTP